MTTPARIAFAVLVCATFAAFFVAQKLKSTPPRVQDLKVREFFSPNRDGRFDRTRVSFILKRADDITATVVDRSGDVVRRLVDNRRLAKGERVSIPWNGRDDRGRIVADGVYRIRVNLRREGRSVTLPRNIRKDTTPPRLRVASIGPQKHSAPRPELLPRPDEAPARVTLQAAGARRKEILVFRTDVRPARRVFDAAIKLDDDATQWTWNGTARGRRVAAGTYLVIVRARDRAGNVGSSAPIPPRFAFREPLPGRGGITVRYLTAQGSTRPVPAGEQTGVAVDSVDKNFNWSVRRVGEGKVRKRGRGTRSRLVRFTAPGGKSGLYLFEVRTRSRKAATPVVVQSGQERDVLVVLPVTTWQGLNPYDDDGDGRPNTLGAGLPVRVARNYVKDGLPDQIRRHEALLLSQLDRRGHRYDITTDVALGLGEGRKLPDYRGVILAGDTRWLAVDAARALRRYVRDGGRLLSVGTESLQRTVTLTPGGRAIGPTLPTQRDLFGARLRPIVRGPVTLVNVIDDIDLFAGTEGQFPNIPAVEETIDVRGGASAIVAAAAAQDGRRQVIVASRLGDGLVIRPGMPDFSAGLRDSTELAAFLDGSWNLLRRR
jgi:hypothetical protein